MIIRSMLLFIWLLAAAVACAQNFVPLKFDAYDPGSTGVSAEYPCTQPSLKNSVSTATGFKVDFDWSCRAATVTGSLQMDFSPQLVAGNWDGDSIKFSTPLAMTARADFTVPSPSTDKKPSLLLIANFRGQDGSPNAATIAAPDLTCSSSSTTGSASMSCSLQRVGGFTPATVPPLYIGVRLAIPVDLLGVSYVGQMWVYGQFSACTGTACGTSPLVFDHMEVVQVVPVSDPDTKKLILVPNKSTVVRVFAKSSQKTTANVTLTAVGRGAAPLSQAKEIGPDKIDPDNYGQSADFLLPPEWTTQSQLTLQAQLQPVNGSAVTSDPQTVDFRSAPNWPAIYRVWALRVCEARSGAEELCAGSLSPWDSSGSPVDDVDGLMRKILPVSELSRTQYALRTWHTQIKTMPLLREKLARLYLQTADKLGTDAPDLLLAWIPQNGTLANSHNLDTKFYIWLAKQFGVDNLIGISEDDISTQVEEASLAASVAYQLGAPVYYSVYSPPIGVTGYDPHYMSPVVSTVSELNFGTIQRGTGTVFRTWVSPAQYLALYNAYAAKPKLSPALAARATSTVPAAASPSPYLMITGTVQADASSGSFSPGFLTTSANAAPAPNASGNFCLHFSSASAALSDYCFQVPFQDAVTGAALPSAMFAIRAPFPSAATRVSLVANSGANKGKELAAVNKSAAAPTVQITSPHSGDRLNAGQIDITWTGLAAGGAALTYNLSSSSDSGATWTPLDVAITETQYQLDTTQIAGGSQVMFQVDASDGLNTATAVVGPLTITQTPQISLPASPFNCGKALLGGGADRPIPVSNTGTGPLTITAATLDNSVFRVISPALPVTVDAGSQQNINVRFAPIATGVQSAVLTITSSDPAHPTVSLALRAEGVATPVPTVSLAAQSLACGSAPVGGSADATLNVNNLGPGPLTVSLANSSNAVFSVSRAGAAVHLGQP